MKNINNQMQIHYQQDYTCILYVVREIKRLRCHNGEPICKYFFVKLRHIASVAWDSR